MNGNGFTAKQKIFIDEYLKCWNATEAARRAGYSEKSARISASRNMSNANISDEIQRRIAENAMSADEVLARLGDMARADISDFVDVMPGGHITMVNLEKAQAAQKTGLIKKIKQTKNGLEIELYDAQQALVHLGRHHKLFTDRIELSGWQRELLELIQQGELKPEDVINELGPDIAEEFFESAGITFAGVRETPAQSEAESPVSPVESEV